MEQKKHEEEDDRDYNRYIAGIHIWVKREALAEMFVWSLIYGGLGFYILYEYMKTGMNQPLLIGWWIIGGWIYYRYGVKRWK